MAQHFNTNLNKVAFHYLAKLMVMQMHTRQLQFKMKAALNNLNCIICLFCFFLATHTCAKTIISGKFWNSNEDLSVYYFAPIDGIFNIENPQKINLKKDNSFKINLDLKRPGFILIETATSRTELFTNGNDSISFNCYFNKILKDKSHPDSLKIEGTNREGNIICNRYKILTLDQTFLTNQLLAAKTYSSVDDLFQSFLSLEDSLLSPLETAFRNNQIDKTCYSYLNNDIKTNLAANLNIFFHALVSTVADSSKRVNTNEYRTLVINPGLFTKNSFDTLRLLIYKTININSPEFAAIPSSIFTLDSYSNDLFNGLIKTNTPYDSSFLLLNDENKNLGYLKGRSLELAWYNWLYWSIKDNPESPDVKINYKMFREFFPDSGYLNFLSEELKEAKANAMIAEPVASNEKPVFLNSEQSTLEELIQKKFNNKNVFIDLWATWCEPCLEEMAYAPKLYNFLKSKNIAIVYVCINDVSEQKNWKDYVDKKSLNGCHLLASQQLIANIKGKVYKGGDILIPRYLLIDKNGNIINDNLPRPSDFENLKKAINKLIGPP